MRQTVAIATNAFMELIRQPIFLLLMTTSAGFIVFLSSVYYFGLGDDQIMIKQSVLAVMFLSGLFGAVLSASAAVAHEIRTGTALAVLAKPVGRAQFLIGKYLGLAGALTLLTYVNYLAALLAGRMAFDVYGDPDEICLSIFYGAVLLAYLLGGFSNFFLRRPFVADAVFFLVTTVTLAFVIANFIDPDGQIQRWGTKIDWRLTPASILILFALWILAGIALACSTRWEVIPTLAICSGVFLVGLISDYFFGIRAAKGELWAQILYAITPNLQVLWVSDAMEAGRSIPWSYVGRAVGYLVGYLGAALALALLLFEERELN